MRHWQSQRDTTGAVAGQGCQSAGQGCQDRQDRQVPHFGGLDMRHTGSKSVSTAHCGTLKQVKTAKTAKVSSVLLPSPRPKKNRLPCLGLGRRIWSWERPAARNWALPKDGVTTLEMS